MRQQLCSCAGPFRFLPQAEEYIDERHRHRYEVNPEMVEDLEAEGLRFVGRDETGTRMEIVELAPELEHPFFVGSQFHPEVGSKPGFRSGDTAQGSMCLKCVALSIGSVQNNACTCR